MKRKLFVRIVAIVLVLLMVVALLPAVFGSAGAVTQAEIDLLEDERDDIRSKRESLNADLDELQAQQNTILEQKEALDKQNELTRQDIELVNKQIDVYGRLIDEKAIELEAALEREEEQGIKFRARIRAMEETSPLDYISVLFKATSFADLISKIENINEMMQYDSALEKEYIAARENVQAVKAEYEDALADQEVKKEELLELQEQLEKDIKEAEKLIADLEENIEAYRILIEQNDAEEASVQAEIDRLMEQLKAQEAGYNDGNVVNAGYFIWPTTSSYVTSLFGTRFHPVLKYYRTHYGIDIAANSGSNIYAAASGTVSVATENSSYGNYVLIYHNNGTATLYAHMSSIAVSAGQSVSQGDIIGYVGSTGLSTGPHLHFEIRVGGACVDPLNYYYSSQYSISPNA